MKSYNLNTILLRMLAGSKRETVSREVSQMQQIYRLQIVNKAGKHIAQSRPESGALNVSSLNNRINK